MPAENEPAELVKGVRATAKQAWGDLFIWKQRVVITNDLGESHAVWRSPPPLRNPISLFMLLSAKDWLYFLVGLFAWTADAFDFHALSIQTVKVRLPLLLHFTGPQLTSNLEACGLLSHIQDGYQHGYYSDASPEIDWCCHLRSVGRSLRPKMAHGC